MRKFRGDCKRRETVYYRDHVVRISIAGYVYCTKIRKKTYAGVEGKWQRTEDGVCVRGGGEQAMNSNAARRAKGSRDSGGDYTGGFTTPCLEAEVSRVNPSADRQPNAGARS